MFEFLKKKKQVVAEPIVEEVKPEVKPKVDIYFQITGKRKEEVIAK